MSTEGRSDAVRKRLRDSETKLRTAEEALREHAARLDEAQAIAHIGSWEWDVVADVVTWSDEMFRVYGLEQQGSEVDYKRFLDFVHPDDRPNVDQAVQHAFAATSDFTFEHRIVRSDGEERILQARGRVTADESGTVVRMAGIGHDVTEQREAERQAATAETAIGMAQRIADLQLITEAALSHLALEDLLPELLARICQALDVEDAALLLMDSDGETLVLRAARGIGHEEIGFRLAVGGGFAGRVAAERKTLVILEAAHRYVASPALKEARMESIAGAPLFVRDEVLGVLHVGSLHERRFTSDEVGLIELAAERAALAIDHARVYERERTVAETLQRALLPAKLPELPGMSAAVRYVPASDGVDIGGDWYDVIPLPGGDVGIVLGDVTGHGLEAAALMAQLRHGLRAYALENLTPAEIAERLDRLIYTPDLERLATLIYAVIAPDRSMRFVNAGHLPPLIVSSDGSTRLLDKPGGLPIGCQAGPYTTQEAQLDPGDVLVLYTDGLVERRGESIDEGIARLRAAVATAPADAHELADHVLRNLLPWSGGEDDIALMTVRPEPVPATSA
jgi:sigma-B regulation protein RsbU (phosphoserine phosphatase)